LSRIGCGGNTCIWALEGEGRGWIKFITRSFASCNPLQVYQIKEDHTSIATCIGQMRNSYAVLVEKLEGRRPLGRTRYRWRYNIK
jgi:hypothetical protein